MKNFITIILIAFITPFSFSQIIQADVYQSDYFIDVFWVLPGDPCLLDENDDPYDVVTTRLLRDGEEVFFQTYEEEDLASEGPNIDFTSQSDRIFTVPLYLSPVIQNLQNQTLEFWFKSKGSSSIQNLMQYGGFQINIANNTSISIEGGQNYALPVTVIDNAWTHIAITSNMGGNSSEFYINGDPVGIIPEYLSVGSLLNLGTPTGSTETFECGGIRIWDIIRTANEINANFTFPDPMTSTHLVCEFKADPVLNKFIDVATTYDGEEQGIVLTEGLSNTLGGSVVPFVPTSGDPVVYPPITGTFRDYVGPNLAYNYELTVFAGSFGNIDAECVDLSAVGITLPFQAPVTDTITTERLDEIFISWQNKSDLATSYKLFRDGNLIATVTEGIEKDSVISFTDQYNFNSSTSIQSGQDHIYTLEMNSSISNQTLNYNLGSGRTLDINFVASKDDTSRVLISWANAASLLIDKYRLYRNNKQYALKSKGQISHVDALPHYGDSINYQLRLIKDDTVLAAYSNRGYVVPNGRISGRVLTEEGQYPVKDVVILATRQSTGDTVTTISNNVGEFSFSGLSYGLRDSFTIQASLDSQHTFTYLPMQNIGINANNPAFDDVVIRDDFTFSEGSTQYTLTADAYGVLNEDRAEVTWEFLTNAPKVFLDVRRNGDIIYSTTVEPNASLISESLIDLEGLPKEETKYQVRLYDIVENTVSSLTKEITIIYPDVSKIPVGNFTAVIDTLNSIPTGNVSLQWAHTSQNIAAFRIYRNDSLVTELPKSIFEYTDSEAPFDSVLHYTITAIRAIENTTYETKTPTVATSIINLGAMPAPMEVEANPLQDQHFISLTWIDPLYLSVFNYSGYCVYRNGILIQKLSKDAFGIEDYHAAGMSNIVYEVSRYRTIENGIIESVRVPSNAINHPPLAMARDLYASAVPAEGVINLTWDDGFFPLPAPPKTYDGFQLFYNGSLLAKLPFYITDYKHLPNSGTTHNYQLYRYKIENGNEILSESPSTDMATMSPQTGSVYPPQNLTATRDLPNHVKLCWEYLDFVPSSFEILRDNELIATLPEGTRSYYDYTADPTNHRLAYRVRAVQSGQSSKYVGALGDIIGHQLVYGTITHGVTKLGMANLSVFATINGYNRLVTKTDSSGYYRIPITNEIDDGFFKINVLHPEAFQQSDPILISGQKHYEVNLELSLTETFVYTKQASIEYADIDNDIFDLAGNISWQPTNTNYSGVEITRGLNVIAEVSKEEGNLFVDTTAVPGINYVYQFRTYLNTNLGKVFSPYHAKEITYAPISPVINLTGTPLIEENAVQIQWSHLYDHADGYAISRNGTFIDDVLTGDPFTFTDSTGTRAEQYTYTLVAYKVLDEQVYFSEETSVTVTYPGPAKVKNLTLDIPYLTNISEGGNGQNIPIYLLNHINLSWEYNGYNKAGYKIFRNDTLIATIPKDSLSYQYYYGLPETNNTYAVSAIVSQNGVFSESKKVERDTTFPILQPVYQAHAATRTDIGDVRVHWKYQTPGVDYFKIVILDHFAGDIPLDTVIVGVENTVEEETLFEFEDKNVTGRQKYAITAHSTRNGIEYASVVNLTNYADYVAAPVTNCNATMGTHDRAVKVTWQAPAEANIDSFTIKKYSLPGNVLVGEVTLDKSMRSYMDIFEEGDLIDSFNYEVVPGRIINGVYTANDNGGGCSPLGYPGCINEADVQNFSGVNSPNANGISISIDKQWMAAGDSTNDRVNLYKFENEEWMLAQTLQENANVAFGAAVDIDDKILVVGAPAHSISSGLNKHGGVYLYRLDGEIWKHDTLFLGAWNNARFGETVAVDDGTVVAGIGSLVALSGTGFTNEQLHALSIRVFVRPGIETCPYDQTCTYAEGTVELPVDPVAGYVYTATPPSSIDIDGGDIVIGRKSVPVLFLNPPQPAVVHTVGYATHATIDINNDVTYQNMFLEPGSNFGNNTSEFGADIVIENNIIAVSSPKAEVSNVTAGKVTIIDKNSTGVALQTLTSHAPSSNLAYGHAITMEKDFLGVSEFSGASLKAKLFLYKKNMPGDAYDLVHSPDPNDPKFRSEFYDSGSPDVYPPFFGYAMDISEYHVAVGAPNLGPGGHTFIFDLFKISVENLSATDGTNNDTKVSWSLGGCDDCPVNYIDSFNIYRDAELIGGVLGSTTQFFDEAENLVNGASSAKAGKEYFYEVEAVVIDADFKYKSKKAVDVGYSKRKGKLKGDVFVSGTSSPVPGVTIVAVGVDETEQTTYTYETTSLSDGSFVLNSLYIGEGITYTLTPSYLDHDMTVITGDTYLLTPESEVEDFIIIFDNTAFVVTGQVVSQNTQCGISDVLVEYHHTVNGLETLVDTSITDAEGIYSIIIDPNIDNLNEIRINVENLQSLSGEISDTTYVQYNFIPGEKVYTSFDNFPLVTSNVNFQDTLTYPVTISVENTCGNPLADQPILIRVSSDDGCYEYNEQTDNFGRATINLTPKEYTIAVEDIVGSGVDNYENAGIDFLSLRPVRLDLLSIHASAGDSIPLPPIEPVKFIYHRAVSFAYTTSFDRYLCDETQNPAILTQGDKYELDFILSENHRPGETCEVSEGYIIVRNSGANKAIDTLQLVEDQFESYEFTAGLPNLVAPHAWVISLQYFSDKGSLLGNKIIPIIVEGQRLLPGTGIITDALTDESGDMQMPLLVLRDPPGDGSYSTIESGTTISKSLDFTGASSGSYGVILESEFTAFGVGAFADASIGAGGGNSNGSTLDFSVSTSQAYSTSKLESGVGRGANVIVGAGISSQYGLTQKLEFVDCLPQKKNIIGYGIGGFNSTYAYTVSFIEGLIDGYRRDSINVELDLIEVERADGSPYTKDEMRDRFTSLIKSWEEMLHYHDVETVPHYVLCQDFSYRDDLGAEAQSLYDGWRNGFCTQIGSYDDNDVFTMDEEIIWTPALISTYNNAIAFADEIKELPLDYIDNGDLTVASFDISANNLSVTNQFHNTLGNAAKSAEVFDISGNVNFDRTITAQQSSSTSKSFSRYFYMDIAAGLTVDSEQFAGFGLTTKLTDVEGKLGASIKAEASISVNRSQAESNESTISYHIFDNDPEDQVSFLVLQAPLQDQTPFFIRLGGLSSCPPEEALTVNQDNSPLLIDDPTITVILDPLNGGATSCPPPVYDVDPEEAAVFEIRMGNIGPTGLTRDAEVFLDLESNSFGAIVKIGGSNLNIVSPVFSIPAGGSITQFLTVERPSGTPFYVFEGLRIGIRPACGGEAKFIKIDVHFESPCSPISITKPFEGMIVKRINPFAPNDREVIPFELRDFQANNILLEHVQLQYKRLGTGTDWQNVPGGRIERLTLKAEVDQLPIGQDPLYLFEWDINGVYSSYPDGQYKVRALAFCGVSGRQYSNETEITLARSASLINGYPEPADGRWTSGDEISATYTTDIDCGIYNVLGPADMAQYLTLIDLETMLPVPFTQQCQNNKMTILPTGDMASYDGHTLRATYKKITNIIGNFAQDVIWDFKVITQLVDWEEQIIEVTLYENEIKTVSTSLFNTSSSTVNGLTLSGAASWYSFDANPFSVNGDSSFPVELTFDGAIGVGTYMTTIQVNGLPGRIPSMIVKLNVLKNVPTPTITGTYTDSMELVMNWSFLAPFLPSTDINDVIQVYKDGQIRGVARIKEQGNFFYARIKVYGNVSDEGGLLDFVIWNADEAVAYNTIASTSIPFKANTSRGVLTNPEILLVEDDVFEFRQRIYVDSLNVNGVQDGKSWATAFNDLQDALAVVNAADTIWMAGGTYYPSIGDRNISFAINEGIAIHGGFLAGMTSLSQRTGNDETGLSGNIGIKVTNTDNSYHVIKAIAPDILLDMLTISDGVANGSGNETFGGGLYNTGGVTLQSCKLKDGIASQKGALIYNAGSLVLDGGEYIISPFVTVSNLHNDPGGLITIKQNVEMKEE